MEMHDDFQRLRRAIPGGALPPSTRKAPSSSATRSRDMCGNLQTSLKGLRRGLNPALVPILYKTEMNNFFRKQGGTQWVPKSKNHGSKKAIGKINAKQLRNQRVPKSKRMDQKNNWENQCKAKAKKRWVENSGQVGLTKAEKCVNKQLGKHCKTTAKNNGLQKAENASTKAIGKTPRISHYMCVVFSRISLQVC